MTDSSPATPAENPPDTAEAPLDFDVVLRGYDRAQVMSLLETMQRSIAEPATGGAITPAQAREGAGFDVVLRGYDRAQVHTAYERLLNRLAHVHGEAVGGPEGEKPAPN
ncbi:hypothetical protein [Streptomonospora alba]|uniref:hypothetical protein n=1 Tax=Streptomonospora alba TaxID=183763 RepID=UPI00069C5BC7|nr:hypothetical protein [Streptomonospora alba]